MEQCSADGKEVMPGKDNVLGTAAHHATVGAQ